AGIDTARGRAVLATDGRTDRSGLVDEVAVPEAGDEGDAATAVDGDADEVEVRADLEGDAPVVRGEVDADVADLAAGARGGAGEGVAALVAGDRAHDLEPLRPADPKDEQRPVVLSALEAEREERPLLPWGQADPAQPHGGRVEAALERLGVDAPGRLPCGGERRRVGDERVPVDAEREALV